MAVLTKVSRSGLKGHRDELILEHHLYIPDPTAIKAYYDFFILIDGVWVEVAETSSLIAQELSKQ